MTRGPDRDGAPATRRCAPHRIALPRHHEVGVPKETAPGERRVALVPDVVRKLTAQGRRRRRRGRGGRRGAASPTRLYEDAGATIGDPWAADVVAKVAPPDAGGGRRACRATPSSSASSPRSRSPESTRGLADAGVTAFAMEAIPRISRAQAMDALS